MTERSLRSKQHWYIANRRKHKRLGKSVLVKILKPTDEDHPVSEATETLDICASGVRLLLNFPVQVGEKILISANEPELKAHMAAFEVRWAVPVDENFLVGAELDMPSYKWQLDPEDQS